VSAGVLQVGSIAVQLVMMQRYFLLQPVVLLVAAAILLVAGVGQTAVVRRGDSS
jgi:hypothetical protein